ncbi:MAG: glutamine-hydrolyzing carbamoyl-phosphate synthase small subunit, partial [Myxococcaceae bacterium]
LLALADGTLFWGESVGALGVSVGEVVFNTAMTGYQEILTDPSYARQIINFTSPHIGIVGVNSEDMESKQIWAAGVVMRELSWSHSSWRSQGDLAMFLKKHNKIALSGIDTRKLTHILRNKGSQSACLMAGKIDPEVAVQKARDFAGLEGSNLIHEVSCQKSWSEQAKKSNFNIAVLDFGIKSAILENLLSSGANITVFPADTKADAVLAMHPDGVFLSNGPGDPAACLDAIAMIQVLLERSIPIFGICLGHQLLALASGGKTLKMEHGHHGSNHPILEISSGKVFISSQNHGFSVDEETLPACLEITHKSLFDGTVAGIRRLDKPAFSFQGHPEASPGPQELKILFEQFIKLMEKSHGKTN